MGWKRVAWAGCLAPVLAGGCRVADPATRDRLPDAHVGHTEQAIGRHIHHDAREAWRAVRDQFPRRCFSPEFRDGFLDGYADYLDRGGDGQPPAAPPLRYTRHARYFTPEGHALLKDYFLGFKYGADVAITTGQRQFLTVPVLLADGGPVAERPVVVTTIPPPPMPAATPLPVPRVMPSSDAPLPKAGARKATPKPGPKPVVEGDLSKFLPPSPAAEADDAADVSARVPPPDPPLPVIPTPGVPVLAPPPRPAFTVRLPDPPAEVPSLPAGVPIPPMTDDLPPALPANHTTPPPLPPNHPAPGRK